MLAAAILMLASLAPGGGAGLDDAEPARVTLLAEPVVVDGYSGVLVGVRFELAEGWHVYYENPGESGLPPRVTFDVPPLLEAVGSRDGLSVPPGDGERELGYEVPATFESGGVIGYGYAGEVVYTTAFTAPAGTTLEELSVLEVAADVRYLICDDEICLPGSAAVSAVVGGPDEDEERAWRASVARQPVEASASPDVIAVDLGEGTARVEWAGDVEGVTLIPVPPAGVFVKEAKPTSDGRVTTLEIDATPIGDAELPATMKCLLTYTNQEGEPKGVTLHVPLAPTPTPTTPEGPDP